MRRRNEGWGMRRRGRREGRSGGLGDRRLWLVGDSRIMATAPESRTRSLHEAEKDWAPCCGHIINVVSPVQGRRFGSTWGSTTKKVHEQKDWSGVWACFTESAEAVSDSGHDRGVGSRVSRKANGEKLNILHKCRYRHMTGQVIRKTYFI